VDLNMRLPGLVVTPCAFDVSQLARSIGSRWRSGPVLRNSLVRSGCGGVCVTLGALSLSLSRADETDIHVPFLFSKDLDAVPWSFQPALPKLSLSGVARRLSRSRDCVALFRTQTTPR